MDGANARRDADEKGYLGNYILAIVYHSSADRQDRPQVNFNFKLLFFLARLPRSSPHVLIQASSSSGDDFQAGPALKTRWAAPIDRAADEQQPAMPA